MAIKSDKFVPGLVLNRNFFFDVIKPLMDEHFPKLKYAAGMIANGSDVLGYDDPTSMDHNWGPRMRIVLSESDFPKFNQMLDKMFAQNLPPTYHGFPTNYTPESNGYLKQQMKKKDKGPINHLIRIYPLEGFFKYFIGISPKKRMAVEDWLVIPQQSLLEVTAGEVYHDDLNLKKYREKLSYYPDDVWLYMLYIQWDRLANFLGFPPRAGMTGDEFGSRLITTQLINEMVDLLFILERRYMPYPKWRGRALADLPSGPKLIELITKILDQKSWEKRQDYINQAELLLAKIHNSLGITKKVPEKTKSFHGRAFTVTDIKPFSDAAYEAIKSKKLKNAAYPLGSIDQFFNHVRVNHLDYVYNEFKDFIV